MHAFPPILVFLFEQENKFEGVKERKFEGAKMEVSFEQRCPDSVGKIHTEKHPDLDNWGEEEEAVLALVRPQVGPP